MTDIQLDIEYHLPVEQPDTDRFHQAALWVANHFGLQRLAVSISIVDDPTIQSLNCHHLQHDWPTDVISFEFGSRADSPLIAEGEVIASYDTARRVAPQAGWSTEDELLLYIIHGLLHVTGMDDQQLAEQQAMRAAEQACLIALKVPVAANYLARWHEIQY